MLWVGLNWCCTSVFGFSKFLFFLPWLHEVPSCWIVWECFVGVCTLKDAMLLMPCCLFLTETCRFFWARHIEKDGPSLENVFFFLNQSRDQCLSHCPNVTVLTVIHQVHWCSVSSKACYFSLDQSFTAPVHQPHLQPPVSLYLPSNSEFKSMIHIPFPVLLDTKTTYSVIYICISYVLQCPLGSSEHYNVNSITQYI